jgi:adenosylcobyric acid synthase
LDVLAHRVLAEGGTVGGICGGYQLLGRVLRDPLHLESEHEEVEGLGMLPVETTFTAPKIVQQVTGQHMESGCALVGYQVRMGRTVVPQEARPFAEFQDNRMVKRSQDGMSAHDGRLFGTYLHGLFDQAPFRRWWLNRLRAARGWASGPTTQNLCLDARIDRLADLVGQHLSVPMIDRLLEEGLSHASS